MRGVCLTGLLVALLGFFTQTRGQNKDNWYKVYNDTLRGINMDKAIDFLQTKKIKPKKQIIVGIIDSGLDTTSVDILPALWKNPQEKQDRKDNDNNGYTDDLHGWNFLGTKDGTFNMTSAGSEEFREFKRLYPKYKGIENKEAVQDTAEFTYYELMKKKAGIMSYIKYTAYTAVKDEAYQKTDSILKTLNINTDTLTIQGLMQLHTRSNVLEQAIQALFTDLLKIGEHGLWKDVENIKPVDPLLYS